MKRLPAVFISHGSPMNAVEHNAATSAWSALGRTLPKPRAVLVASAHWETSVPMLSSGAALETIHDFGGFPEALYAIRYPARGAPELAERAVGVLKEAGIAAGTNGCRGLDHGAWVPLRWMYPDADVPVVEISLQPALGAGRHVELGRALASLADDGTLIIGSGHTTHNLRDWMSGPRRSEPLPYAKAFAGWVHDTLAAGDTDALIAYREMAPEASRAHPSEEHFLPLLVAWGASGEGARAERFVTGFEGGALANDSYLFHRAG